MCPYFCNWGNWSCPSVSQKTRIIISGGLRMEPPSQSSCLWAWAHVFELMSLSMALLWVCWLWLGGLGTLARWLGSYPLDGRWAVLRIPGFSSEPHRGDRRGMGRMALPRVPMLPWPGSEPGTLPSPGFNFLTCKIMALALEPDLICNKVFAEMGKDEDCAVSSS